MDLPDFIRPYPRLATKLLPRFAGNSVYPYIFLKPSIYQSLKSDSPPPSSLATLAHELHHRQRQQDKGWLRWAFQYLTSRRFRFEEELSAYKISMSIRKYYHQEFEIAACAKALSGPMYLWCTAYHNALKHLQDAWHNTRPIDPYQLINS